MSNYNTFLNILNNIAEKNAFEVYVPSLKRNVKFKPITIKQQKSFYSGVQENTLFNTQFIITTYNIIKENCLEPELVDAFTILDRLSILLSLRKHTLGAGIAVVKDGTTYNLDITECINRVQVVAVPINKTLTLQGFEVEIGVPTILEQYKAEIELRNTSSRVASYKEAVLEIIAGEICKTIKSIKLLQGDSPVVLNYIDLTFEQRLSLLDKLPAEVFLFLQKYIKEVNEIFESVLRFKTEDGKEISFDVNSDFFLSE